MKGKKVFLSEKGFIKKIYKMALFKVLFSMNNFPIYIAMGINH